MCLAVVILYLFASGAQAQPHSARLMNGQQTLTMEFSEQFAPEMHEELRTWIDFIATALLQVYGRWPRDQWTIAVSPVSAGSADPIPWAQVNRGSVDEVEFYTGHSASAEQLKAAWTGYHELSHLLIPYRGWGDMWFSEGLATYYQNLLQVRAGVFDEQALWQKLYDGFMRGRAQSQFSGQSLRSVSSAVRSNGAFMRVYWSGAWYFLAADTRLRQQSGGKRGLDDALARLNSCCADKKMSVVEMAKKLDALNGLVLFYPLYREASITTDVPDFETIFASLGVAIQPNGKIKLQDLGPGAKLRREISLAKPL